MCQVGIHDLLHFLSSVTHSDAEVEKKVLKISRTYKRLTQLYMSDEAEEDRGASRTSRIRVVS